MVQSGGPIVRVERDKGMVLSDISSTKLFLDSQLLDITIEPKHDSVICTRARRVAGCSKLNTGVVETSLSDNCRG